MRIRNTVLLLALALPSLAEADALGDLRATLGRLTATTPVQGMLEVTSTAREEDEKPREGRATVGFETSDAGLRMLYPRNALLQANAETRARAADPERPTPVRNGLRRLEPLDVADLVDAAASLAAALESAQLLEVKPSAFQGKPARLLVFKVSPKVSKSDAKRLEKLDVRLSVWLRDDAPGGTAGQRSSECQRVDTRHRACTHQVTLRRGPV